jgi:plastocyanin
MLRRSWPAVCAVALVAAACGKPEIEVRALGGEQGFVPLVVDAEGLAGAGVSLATDVDGNPHLAYLAFPEEPAEGEEAAALDPLAPTLPAVMHAHLVDNVWTRGPVAEEQAVAEDDETAIAVDADGVHHVAWTAGSQILYSTNAEGEFAEEPEVVADDDAISLSITADEDGTPLIAFVDQLTEAEGPAALVRVATRGGGGWEVETAAEASPDEPISTGIGSFGGVTMVAYGSEGATQFAVQGPNRWSSEVVDESGGAGVSMVVDGNGVPHVSYFDAGGTVKLAEPAADRWAPSEVGAGATTSPTSIAVDDAGVRHLAWQTGEGVAYANDAQGTFAEQELPPAVAGGTQPAVGARVEGTVQVAWLDHENGELQMAMLSDTEPLLAMPSPTAAPPGGGVAACEPGGTDLQLAAPPGAAGTGFDTDCLAVNAAEAYTVTLDNQDTTPHNFSVYTDESATEPLLDGSADIVNPGASFTYQGEPIPEAGEFFFRCDLHPTTMTGTFVVAEAEGGGGAGGGGGGGGGGSGGGP